MNDEELLIAASTARRSAHDAPLAEIYEVNKGGKPTGERHISKHTSAWAVRSNEYVTLAEECRRRGLKQLPMDWDGNSRR